MPSNTHEALVELIRRQPSFVVRLLTDLAGAAVPAHSTVNEGSPNLSESVPTEQRADAVVTLHHPNGTPALGVIAEVQLRVDAAKHYTWPSYLVSLRNRLRCPVVLLVICTSDRVARWAARPIELGGSSAITPFVIGPATIPEITDPVDARAGPELAMLSAITHSENRAVLDALFATFTPDVEHSPLYADLIRTVLPKTARHYLEHLMTTSTWRYQSDFARKYFDQGVAEGKAEGKAEGVLAVLAARGITVSAEVRNRIVGCTDIATLDGWLQRSVSATSTADLFD